MVVVDPDECYENGRDAEDLGDYATAIAHFRQARPHYLERGDITKLGSCTQAELRNYVRCSAPVDVARALLFGTLAQRTIELVLRKPYWRSAWRPSAEGELLSGWIGSVAISESLTRYLTLDMLQVPQLATVAEENLEDALRLFIEHGFRLYSRLLYARITRQDDAIAHAELRAFLENAVRGSRGRATRLGPPLRGFAALQDVLRELGWASDVEDHVAEVVLLAWASVIQAVRNGRLPPEGLSWRARQYSIWRLGNYVEHLELILRHRAERPHGGGDDASGMGESEDTPTRASNELETLLEQLSDAELLVALSDFLRNGLLTRLDVLLLLMDAFGAPSTRPPQSHYAPREDIADRLREWQQNRDGLREYLALVIGLPDSLAAAYAAELAPALREVPSHADGRWVGWRLQIAREKLRKNWSRS